MIPLQLESTPKTPEIHFNNENGVLEMKGMSCAEYALDFFKQLFDWLDIYIENPQPNTVVKIQLKYFNTSSAKCILQFLEKVAQLESKGYKVEINWYYNKHDEQMLADGENYSEIIGMPFNMQQL